MEFDRILTGAVAQIRIGGVIRRKLLQAVVFAAAGVARRDHRAGAWTFLFPSMFDSLQVPPRGTPKGPLPKKGGLVKKAMAVKSWGTIRAGLGHCH